MSKIKILHVITNNDWEIAGAELLSLFDNCQSPYTLMALVPEGSGVTQILFQRGIPVACYDATVSSQGKKIKILKRAIKKIRPDVVHTHTSFYARKAAYKARIPIRVHTQHSIERFGFFAKLLNNRLSSFVIATTESIQKNLRNNGIERKKLRVVYHGVPQATEAVKEKQQLLRTQLNIPQNAFIVISFEHLTETYDYVLDTARELPYNVFVILAGRDGGFKDKLEERVEKENLQNVRIIANALDIIGILSIANVQLNVSETLGIAQASLFLGMSLGKPIVTTDIEIAKLTETEKFNVLSIPPNNVAALDDAITRLKDDQRLYDNLSKNTKANYRKSFTSGLMAKEITRIYNQLTGR